jgi:hypothetical protein
MSGGVVVVELHIVIPELAETEEGPNVPIVTEIEVDENGLASLVSMTQFVGARFGGKVLNP